MSALPLSLQRYLHLIMLKSRSCLPLPYLRVYRVRDTPLVKSLQVQGVDLIPERALSCYYLCIQLHIILQIIYL